MLVTHYQRLLDYIVPDFVHVLAGGRIVKSGDKALALELEKRGYDWVQQEARGRMSAAPTELLGHYRAAFEACARPRRRAPRSAHAAFDRFAPLGFPAARDEALEVHEPAPPRVAPLPGRRGAQAAVALPRLRSRRTGWCSWTGVCGPTWRRRAHCLPALRVAQPRRRLQADGESLAALLRVTQGGGTERFAALNAALCPDGVLLDVAARTPLPSRSTCSSPASAARARHEPSAAGDRVPAPAARRASSSGTSGDDAERARERRGRRRGRAGCARRTSTGCSTAANAAFHIERARGDRARSAARSSRTTLQLGAGLARLDLARAARRRRGAAAELIGLFLADGTQHLDTHVRVDHLAAGTRSREDYRGIAAGRGRGVFNGKVVVHADAQQIEARQTSRNLLLSAGAEIDTKPELEIYADDVQVQPRRDRPASSTTTALFYLRARGIDRDEARDAADPRLRRATCVAHGPCAVRASVCATCSTHALGRAAGGTAS